MTERRMMATLDYGNYVGAPHDIALLIEISGRLTRVEHSKDYRSMHVDADQKPFVTSVGFTQITEKSPGEPPNAALPNATEPAPAPTPDPGFRMTNETASWGDWLTQARYQEGVYGGVVSHEETLRKAFDRGETPQEAAEIPF